MLGKETIRLHYSDTRADRAEKPDEDFILIKGDSFGVGDGVNLLFQEPYPDPSPTAEVTELAVTSLVNFLNQNSGVEGLGLLKEAFSRANTDVRDFNIRAGISPETVDHIEKQYHALTCSYGCIRDGSLYFGQINDSGVMVFDETGAREIDFVLNQSAYIKLLAEKEAGGQEPGSQEQHKYVRSEVVNNRDIRHEGIPVNFGVMTGAHSAEHFMHYGATQVRPGQIVVFYTDGFIPFVYEDEFVQALFEFEEETLDAYIQVKIAEDEKYQKEKSLIALKF